MRIAIFIITTVKSIVIGLLPILMIQTMGEENYSESFYLSIYILDSRQHITMQAG